MDQTPRDQITGWQVTLDVAGHLREWSPPAPISRLC